MRGRQATPSLSSETSTSFSSDIRLSPLCGYVTRLAALFDNPEVFVFLDHFFNARFNVDGCVPGRDSEAFRLRADLLPLPPG